VREAISEAAQEIAQLRKSLEKWQPMLNEGVCPEPATAAPTLLVVKTEPLDDGGELIVAKKKTQTEVGTSDGAGASAEGKRKQEQPERRRGERRQPKRHQRVKSEEKEGGVTADVATRKRQEDGKQQEEAIQQQKQQQQQQKHQQQQQRRLQVLSDETGKELVNHVAIVSAQRYGTAREQRLLLLNYEPATATMKGAQVQTTSAYYLCYSQTQHCSMEWNALDLAPWISDEVGTRAEIETARQGLGSVCVFRT
jgi:hypothetical protein